MKQVATGVAGDRELGEDEHLHGLLFRLVEEMQHAQRVRWRNPRPRNCGRAAATRTKPCWSMWTFQGIPPLARYSGRGAGGKGSASVAGMPRPHLQPLSRSTGRGETVLISPRYDHRMARPRTFMPPNGELRLFDTNRLTSMVQSATGSMIVTSATAPGLSVPRSMPSTCGRVDRQLLDELRPGQMARFDQAP